MLCMSQLAPPSSDSQKVGLPPSGMSAESASTRRPWPAMTGVDRVVVVRRRGQTWITRPSSSAVMYALPPRELLEQEAEGPVVAGAQRARLVDVEGRPAPSGSAGVSSSSSVRARAAA